MTQQSVDPTTLPTSHHPSEARVRVVHFIDGMGMGGTEMNLVRTLRRVDRSRFDLSLVCLRPEGALRPAFEELGLEVIEARVANLYGLAAQRQVVRLAALLRARRTHVVHAHDRYTNFLAPLAARLARVPVVLTSKRWLGTGLKFRVLNGIGYRLSTRVVANSRGVADSLVTDDHLRRGRVMVVPNFLEESAFEPPSSGTLSNWRSEFGITPDSPVLGIVASLRAVKDHATLLRAVAKLVPQHPSLRLVVIGEGDEEGALRQHARELGIAGNICFAGVRPNLPPPYFLFDVAVLCSLHEGFPNTLLEAMAAARPVVATRVGGVPDAVVDGTTGLLVPARDAAGLADAIAKLLASPALRQAMGQAALERARTEFSASVVVHRLEDLYIKLLGAHR